MDGKFDCEGVGNLLDIYGLALSMGIELKKNNRKKTKRVLCDEINEKQEGFNWLHSIAKDQKPYFDEERQQTMILIAFDFFADLSPQPAVQYLYIHHTEGEPFMKDDVEMIKVWWSGFDNPTFEPTENILDAGYDSKIIKPKYTEEEEKQFELAEKTALIEKRKQIIDQEKESLSNLEEEAKEKQKILLEKQRLEEAERQRLEEEKKRETDRLREVEQKRVAQEEEERKRIAKEEAERQRLAKEEAKRILLAKEEAERIRLAKEEEKQRLAKEEARKVAERQAAEKLNKEKEDAARFQREKIQREKEQREQEFKAKQEEQTRREQQARQEAETQRRQKEQEAIEQQKKRVKIQEYTPLQRPSRVIAERSIINQSILPCVVAKVDRSCLLGRRDRYVKSTFDKNLYGNIVEQLGGGSYGNVFRTDKNYAIKCFIGNLRRPNQVTDNDLREMCILRNLNHPNVIEVFQVAIGNATPNPDCKIGIVLPLFSDSLNQIDLQKTPGIRAKIMYQIVRSVAYIHSRGILHRDIKPHNFLIDKKTNQVVLSDFGTSQGLAIPYNRYSDIVVTTWFRAPEIFEHADRYDGAVDVWSIGASWLYFLEVKYLQLEKEEEILAAIYNIFGRPNAPNEKPRINLNLELSRKGASPIEIDLILKMLRIDPKQRITAYDALNHSYFNQTKDEINRLFPAAPIVPPTLSGCGALLVAMQQEPVGEYLQDNDDKLMVKSAFKWMAGIIEKYKYRTSLLFLATSIFHRYVKQTLISREVYLLTAAAAMQTAWKLDADYKTTHPFRIDLALKELAAQQIKTDEATLIEMENKIIKILDADFDRPTPFTFLELLASHRIIDEQMFRRVRSVMSNIEMELGALNKTALELVLFVLRQESIDTECSKLIERVFPEYKQ